MPGRIMSAQITFACRKCGTKLAADTNRGGRTATCPTCGAEVTAPEVPPASESHDVETGQTSKRFDVNCPLCRGLRSVTSDEIGSTKACHCGYEFIVPKPGVELPELLKPTPAPTVAPPAKEQSTAKSPAPRPVIRRSRRKRQSLGLTLVSFAVILALLAYAGSVLIQSTTDPPKGTADDRPTEDTSVAVAAQVPEGQPAQSGNDEQPPQTTFDPLLLNPASEQSEREGDVHTVASENDAGTSLEQADHSKFVGRWRLVHGRKTTLHITLHASGTVTVDSSKATTKGTWEVFGNEVRVELDDDERRLVTPHDGGYRWYRVESDDWGDISEYRLFKRR